ncbi:hypothetical protein ACQ4LE_008336 [Meloidogyne hapla]
MRPLFANEEPFEQHYEIEEEVGSGQFATVRRVKNRATGERFAAKFIRKRRYPTSRRGVLKSHIQREVDILQTVAGHDSIIQLIDLFENGHEMILVLELISGGELFDYVYTNEYLTESEAAQFIYQILRAIKHLHKQQIAHLDIKPENILLKESGKAMIKLIDFGLSRQLPPKSCIREMVGTPEFVAPEIINSEPLQLATDIWALGVVTFILLSGASPFLGKTREKTFANISAVNYKFPECSNFSLIVKDFIGRMLVRDVNRRATVDECLEHEWIKMYILPQQISNQLCMSSNKNKSSILYLDDYNLENIKINYKKYKNIISPIISQSKKKWRKAYKSVRWCCSFLKGIDDREQSRYFKENDSVSSAIFLACERGALPELRQFVSSCFVELAHLKNELDETPLHVASGNGFEDLVHFLLKCGCNPNIGDGQGDTPLIWASRNGHTNVFKYLIKSVEMVNITNKNKETALHIATRYTQGKAVLALLEAGADPHLMDKHLETSLHIAAWDGQNGLLDLLCRFSHFLDIQNSDGDSALHIAAIRGHLECLESLLENGAQVDLQNQSGQTALHMALSRGHVDIAILLLGKGCNSTIQDQNGDTSLHLAAEKGLFTIAQTICQLNIPIDIQNSQGLSPLHIAARFGSIEIVRCLCLAGANIHLKTNDGMTAEIVALAQEHKHIAILLAKVKQEKERQKFVEQLTTIDIPLKRIKLKVFGSQGAGKTRLIHSLQRPSSASSLNSLVESVSRRFSGSLFLSSSSTQTVPTNKGNQNNSDQNSKTDCASSSSATSDEASNSQQQLPPPNRHKTWPYSNNIISGSKECKNGGQQGIDIQNMSFSECGEFSVWNFSGHEPSHICYDHFVGNTDCVHLVVTRCSDDPQDEYKELLYWLNFLKGRVTPSEPIGHCGLMARRAVVAIVGTFWGKTDSSSPSQPPITRNEAEAMMKTLKMRFETHFEIHPQLLLVDLSSQQDCEGLKELRNFLVKSRESILQRLQRPLRLLDPALIFLEQLREKYSQFPCVTWNYFTYLIPSEVNPLASDGHCRQLIQQLQLIGEVVYLRDECKELDYIVISPEWLGTHLLGTLFSNQFAQTNRTNGRLMFKDFAAAFPEVADTGDLLQIMETLQICSLVEPDFEFPSFITSNPPIDIWQPNRPQFLYAGLRIKPARGMEQTMQAIFPRIQVAMRKSMQDFQDPMDAELLQWKSCSKMLSGKMEALIRLVGDSVEVQIRGPSSMSNSAIYFLEDLANLVEQTASEVAPGISTERHFLSPKHLKEHRTNPALFTPEVIMEMQLNESLIIVNSDGEQEEFTDVVCFGSTEVAGLLSLGIDISVAQLQPCTRSELAALLDPSDPMGRDWSILAVRLNLAEALPSVDSTGQSLSRTDQLLAEWAITSAGNASIGRLATILSEMGRDDVKQLLFRRIPLYLFNSTPQMIIENNIVNNNEII